jgi:hypothetical protein
MRKLVAILAVIAIAGALVWWKWSQDSPAVPPATAAAAVPVAGSAAGLATPDPKRVRRLAPEERKQLGLQIAASLQRARAQRAAAASHAAAGGAAPSSDEDPVIPLEAVGKPLQDALHSAIPLLAKCYERAGSATPRTAVAMMTMASDPDLGTVIDTAQITDAAGKQLDHALDECLRDTIDSLALPPLGQPGKLQLQYSFKSD